MKAYKIEELDIRIKTSTSHDNSYRVIQMRIGDGLWKEVALPTEIVKERINDASMLRHLVKFFIKE